MLAIPDRYRTYVYAVYATLGVVIGSIQVGYAAAEAGQPVWLTVALAVFAYVGGAIGYTAATHTPRQPRLTVTRVTRDTADRLDP